LANGLGQEANAGGDIRDTIVCRERCEGKRGRVGEGEEEAAGAIDWATGFFAGDEGSSERIRAWQNGWMRIIICGGTRRRSMGGSMRV
jgi:hypothetical protein